MRIAFVTSTFPSKEIPSLGIFNYRAIKSIQKDCSIQVYKLRTWKPFRPLFKETEFDGIAVTEVFVPHLPVLGTINYLVYVATCYFILRRKLKPQDYDILYTSYYSLSGLACAGIANKTGLKHVAHIIGSDINFDLPKWLRYGLGNILIRGTHAVVSVSEALKKRLNELLPAVSNITVLYRGIDVSIFKASPMPQATDINFLFMGGFPSGIGDDGINLKGGMTLLEIWETHEEDFNNRGFKLSIAGHGTEKKEIQSWHKRLKYPQSVHIQGMIKQPEVIRLIQSSHIVLIPSLAEGLPNLAVEAAALGRIVIGSDVGGIPEIVQHNQTGIIIPSHNKEALLNAMLNLADNKKDWNKMAQAARQRVEKYFDSRNFAPALLKVFKEQLN
jgi:glycosyltransferase involved in cell wall biosynthesis